MARGLLASLGHDTYEEYLRSPWWRQRRKVAGRAANWTCPCGARATQIHHRTYERLGNERADDLHALCEPCHAKIHRWIKDDGMALRDATDAVVYGIDPVGDGAPRKMSKKAKRRARSRARRKQRQLEKSQHARMPDLSRLGMKKPLPPPPSHKDAAKERKRLESERRKEFTPNRTGGLPRKVVPIGTLTQPTVSSSPAGAPGGSSGSTRSSGDA